MRWMILLAVGLVLGGCADGDAWRDGVRAFGGVVVGIVDERERARDEATRPADPCDQVEWYALRERDEEARRAVAACLAVLRAGQGVGR